MICLEVPLAIKCKLNMSGLFFIINRPDVYPLASRVHPSASHHVTFCCAFLAFNCFQHFLKQQQPDLVMVKSEVGHTGCVCLCVCATEMFCVLTCLYKANFQGP